MAYFKCGVHFCEVCGDCLHCYGEDPCYGAGDLSREHVRPRPTFTAIEWIPISDLSSRGYEGVGWIVIAINDKERPRDNPGLKGTTVVVDGIPYTCLGIDTYKPAFPIREGETVALLITLDIPPFS